PGGVSAIAEGPVSISATLTALPGNAPIANEAVLFNFGAAMISQLAVTDSNGVATVSVNFPAAGMFTAVASFSDAANFYNASTSVPFSVFVRIANTSLGTLSAPSTVLVGN